MSNLKLKTVGVRGGLPIYQEKIGATITFIRHDEDYVVIDDFEGQGETYKKRELTEIRVYENGSLIFQGDKYEFFNKLKS